MRMEEGLKVKHLRYGLAIVLNVWRDVAEGGKYILKGVTLQLNDKEGFKLFNRDRGIGKDLPRCYEDRMHMIKTV